MMKKNDICTDIGYASVNHEGEQLCGDHIEVVEKDDETIIVLADGLGSGVKACILSTLTAKIISTMLSEGMKLEDTLETVMATLPICSVRKVAYSTFTVIRIVSDNRAEIIQYDNPSFILMRGGTSVELPATHLNMSGKDLYRFETELEEGDTFVFFSDGVEHAGIGNFYNFGWKRENIVDFMQTFCGVGFSAKTLSAILLDECYRLYDGKPADDVTVLIMQIRKRVPMSILIGPPSDPNDREKMMSLFFAKEGKHIVCGGTTSKIAAEFLGKPIKTNLLYFDPAIPPTAEVEGIDLVTEGVITINRVLEYAKAYLADNHTYTKWNTKQDGASQIARLLFEEATDINFFVGRAINPAHQNPALPINFNIKMRLVDELADCLTKMGKKIKVLYF